MEIYPGMKVTIGRKYARKYFYEYIQDLQANVTGPTTDKNKWFVDVLDKSVVFCKGWSIHKDDLIPFKTTNALAAQSLKRDDEI